MRLVDEIPCLIYLMPTIFRHSRNQEFIETIWEVIQEAISIRGACSLMLAGGTTPHEIYHAWSERLDFPHERITYFFGDERCVSPDCPESNFRAVCGALFPQGISENVRIHRMEAESPDQESAARAYEKLLPERIDVLMLGMGEDGHIASLFPGDRALLEMNRSVVPVVGPKPPKHRLTITPKVIANARTVFLLANGSKKGKVLSQALSEPEAVLELPVRLTLGRIWLVDQPAADELPPSFREIRKLA